MQIMDQVAQAAGRKSKKRRERPLYKLGTITLAEFENDPDAFEKYMEKMCPYSY